MVASVSRRRSSRGCTLWCQISSEKSVTQSSMLHHWLIEMCTSDSPCTTLQHTNLAAIGILALWWLPQRDIWACRRHSETTSQHEMEQHCLPMVANGMLQSKQGHRGWTEAIPSL